MKNPLEVLFGKDSKQYRKIIKLLDTGNYIDVLKEDAYSFDNRDRFNISDSLLVDKIKKRLEKEVISSSNLLQTMIDNNYFEVSNYINIAVANDTKVLDKLISSNAKTSQETILMALNNGYAPTPQFIENNYSYFNDIDIISKLLDNGYKFSDEALESKFSYVFSNPKLMLKALEWGYTPTSNFLSKCSAFKDEVVLDKLLPNYQISDTVLNTCFTGNPTAQRKIVEINPSLLLKLNGNSELYTQFWIEAIKKDFIPEKAIKSYSMAGNHLLMSKVIRHKPDYIKFCQVVDTKERENLDSLSLAMGYSPTKEEVIGSKYIRNSYKLMESAIMQRPEMIKYIETRSLEGVYITNITQEQFFDLAKLSIKNGYIPEEEDIKITPRLADSYDIMKAVISKYPKYIEKCSENIENIEELSSTALSNGYQLTDILPKHIETCECIVKEKFIKYHYVAHPNRSNYSLDLYNFLIENNCKIGQIIHLFFGNYDVMKLIVQKEPSRITDFVLLNSELTRNQIDEICLLAVNNGYIPNENDKVFGKGLESAKLMIKRFPNFINETSLFDGFFINATPIPEYEELCQLALDNGFVPNPELMGYGRDNKFKYSYSIMKKVLETNSYAIDICMVEDKDKYDELCKIAINNGYIPNTYGITHHGKLRTSYDMLAIVVKDDPSVVLDAELSSSNELENLLKLAIHSGLNIDSLDDNKLMKLFLPIPKEKWILYLKPEKIIVLENSIKFYNTNDEIASTLKPEFLNEAITSNFTKLQIEILSCYPKLQEEIINLNKYYNKNSLKTKLVYELLNEFKDNMQWVTVLENVLKNINSPEFRNLFLDLDGREVTDIDRKKILYLLNYGNHLDISSYSDLQKIDDIRVVYIEKLIQRNTVGSLKSAYLEKVYGIDLPTAINFVKIYGESLNGSGIDSISPEDKDLFIILSNMKNIINTNNTEILKSYINSVQTIKTSYNLMLIFENKLKEVYTNEFNKSFTKPLAEDKIDTNNPNEEKFDIYYAAGKDGKKKTRLMITSIGAYTGMTEPDDYYASWNMAKIASHGCCCSYVGEKNLGTAEVKYCCLGFTDYEIGALQLSAPYDLCSYSTPDQYTVTASYSSMYLMPDDVLEYTRHTHNETVWERRKLNNDESLSKKQPSYIVYFVDNFEDRLNNEEAKRQWESVKKASENFMVNGLPLPIMVVEREKIAISQKDSIDEMLANYKKTLDKNKISKIIVNYESNYAGNRKFHPEISDKYFPKSNSLEESIVGEIINVIENTVIINKDLAVSNLNELERTILKEKEKYNNTQHGVDQALPSFNIEEALTKISIIKEDLKIGKVSVISTINELIDCDKEYLKKDVPGMPSELISNQLSNEEVKGILSQNSLSKIIVNLENEMQKERVNADLKVHGQRHISDVILFSGIIGSKVLIGPEDLRLLLLSAKYHDVGRTIDGYQEHAKASSKVAENRLQNLCSFKEIAIIKTAIEFHEIERNTSDDVFKTIALQNGLEESDLIRTRQIAEILKDADALDRTRFITDARINTKLLKYPISKRLVRFASVLNENYAIEDLKKFNSDEQILVLLNNKTPQEVLRTIRRSITSEMTPDDIMTFISSWSKNEAETLGGKYGR